MKLEKIAVQKKTIFSTSFEIISGRRNFKIEFFRKGYRAKFIVNKMLYNCITDVYESDIYRIALRNESKSDIIIYNFECLANDINSK